ncbi:MAG: hypothetical protein ACI9HK_005214 [Pirellulaceae bacterium]|jgi:hypothetical protein
MHPTDKTVCDTAIYLVLACSLCLNVCVWCGLSRLHWFFRAMSFCLLLVMLTLVRAFEPAFILLWCGPTVILLTAWLKYS